MKIAFWSPMAGQTGTTSNLLATAIMTSLSYNKNIYLTQFHFNNKSMENALLGTQTGKDMFENIGLDSIIRNLKNSELDEDTILNGTLSFFNNRLHLLPGTTKENKNLYELEVIQVLTTVLHSVEKHTDMVFIDTPSGSNKLSQIILEEADLIFVNLGQNKTLLKEYFHKQHFLDYKLSEDKIIYIIGNYHADSKYNLKNLERSYKLLKNNTLVVPYNVEFMDAASEGKVLNYLYNNLIHCKKDANRTFQEEIKKVVDRLMIKAGKGVKLCDI